MVSKTYSSGNSQGTEGVNVFVRPKSTYTSNCSKYLIRDRTFDRQYASFYISRLRITSRNLLEEARKKWGKLLHIILICTYIFMQYTLIL